MSNTTPKRDTTIFYRSFYEAIKDLPIENQSVVYNAIFEYTFNFIEVDLSGVTVKVGGTSAVVTFSADGKGELKAS